MKAAGALIGLPRELPTRDTEVPIPSTPSFNCECEQCGARIWAAHSSPIEPVRCVWLAAQRTTITSDKQSRTEQ